MKKIVLYATVAVALAACSNPMDANEKNFAKVTDEYLRDRGAVCLTVGDWPIDIGIDPQSQKMRRPVLDQLTVLESLGFVRSEQAEVRSPLFEATRTVLRYSITDAGRAVAKDSKNPDALCFGQKALAKIIKWEGPISFSQYQEARIVYTYTVKDVASWTERDDVQRVFPAIRTQIENAEAKEQQLDVKLTSAGWEPKRM